MRRIVSALAGLLSGVGLAAYAVLHVNLSLDRTGQIVDTLNGIPVYYNGSVGHVIGRNVSIDGYNIGLKYQCVEFVKRYYFVRFGHRMPDSYGHARDFFDPALSSGVINSRRGLQQFRNGDGTLPRVEDLLVFGPTFVNPYGHVAIVARAGQNIEIVQQNPGPFASSRERLTLSINAKGWRIDHPRVLGWLRLPSISVNPPSVVAY